MARPINADATATRRRILDAACRLLENTSPSKFSNREVARQAHVSIAMVNHHFGSKQGLIDACIDTMYQGLDGLGVSLQADLSQGTPLAEVLEKAVVLSYRLARERRAFVRMLITRIVDAGELDSTIRPTFEFPGLALLAGLIAPALGVSQLEVRLRLKTILFAVTRYAAATDESLVGLVELPADQATEAIEAHLRMLVAALLPI